LCCWTPNLAGRSDLAINDFLATCYLSTPYPGLSPDARGVLFTVAVLACETASRRR
jgi:hypothetical protein